MEELYSLHILFAIIGASLGGLKSLLKLFRKPNTNNALKTKASIILFTAEASVDFVISVALTVGFVSYYYVPEEQSIHTYLVSGIFIGFIGAYALEVFEAVFPNIFRQVIQILLNQVSGINISDNKGESQDDDETSRYLK